jgi:hypothetical protein
MNNNRIPLDLFDYELTPPAMKAYLRNYGYTFSKKACEYAVSLMQKTSPNTGRPERIEPWSKEKVEDCFKKNGVIMREGITYTHVYLFNMAMADYFKSSLPDERAVCLHVKDIVEDVDGNPDNIFRKWIISMDGSGYPIYWEDLL